MREKDAPHFNDPFDNLGFNGDLTDAADALCFSDATDDLRLSAGRPCSSSHKPPFPLFHFLLLTHFLLYGRGRRRGRGEGALVDRGARGR